MKKKHTFSDILELVHIPKSEYVKITSEVLIGILEHFFSHELPRLLNLYQIRKLQELIYDDESFEVVLDYLDSVIPEFPQTLARYISERLEIVEKAYLKSQIHKGQMMLPKLTRERGNNFIEQMEKEIALLVDMNSRE